MLYHQNAAERGNIPQDRSILQDRMNKRTKERFEQRKVMKFFHGFEVNDPVFSCIVNVIH